MNFNYIDGKRPKTLFSDQERSYLHLLAKDIIRDSGTTDLAAAKIIILLENAFVEKLSELSEQHNNSAEDNSGPNIPADKFTMQINNPYGKAPVKEFKTFRRIL